LLRNGAEVSGQAAGLFHRAILQSGAAHHAISPASALLITRRLAAILDVAPTQEALGRVPQSVLLAAQQQLRAEVTANPDPARWGDVAANLMPSSQSSMAPCCRGTLPLP
jgi:para-nitrobenzyl esterase